MYMKISQSTIFLKNYLKYSDPEILMIQEIKTEEKNFPYNDFKTLGYKPYVFGQKSYNGVAIVSKIKIQSINTKINHISIMLSKNLSFQ